MSDIKPVSFRINEEDQIKFKEYATELGFNQADAFSSLISMLELEKAKNNLGDRSKSIDSFKETTTKLINFYLNALEENITTEDRIREELSKEIKIKEDTIINLMDQLQELKTNENELKNYIKDIETNNNKLLDQLQKINIDIEDKQKQLDIANRNNNNLQEQLAEYKEYKNVNKQLQEELYSLKQMVDNNDKANTDLVNINKQLEDKIKNHIEMIDFYKTNNLELKANIKAMEDKNEKDLTNIKEENKKALELQIKSIEDKLNAQYNIELQKKDLEIEKLKNELKDLRKNRSIRKTNK